MIGEKINHNLLNLDAAQELLKSFDLFDKPVKVVVAIAGESGSGKTHMATALQAALETNAISACVLHMDDFFFLPPASNHAQRLNDITHVGPQEVNIELLNSLIADFKSNENHFTVPTVDYYANSISQSNLELGSVQVLIIEGTYSFFLQNSDFNLFMSRDFTQTTELRLARNRGNEAQDEFVERVLKIEHEIIAKQASKADAFIDYHFKLQLK
ncbi:MAG: uridine kinase [Flavobacteriales bacterium]